MIGRNEGSRLLACLDSIQACAPHIVYVDSASTDHSVQEAMSRNVQVVQLDMALKFTAARARNAGFNALVERFPQLEYVQFVDGDCIVDANWLSVASDYLQHHAGVAIVCGRRRERYPQASVYNQLCDIEWNTPIGETKACGGDALARVAVIQAVHGFNESLIAGEEPEMCIRVREAGFKIWRLDHDMTYHDANIHHLAQWWKRTMRAGYAYAEGADLHGASPELHWVKESRRAWFWGGIIPLVLLVLLVVSLPLALVMVALLLLQLLKLSYQNKKMAYFAPVYAAYLMLGKSAEMVGQVKFYWHKWLNKKMDIIEYK